MSSMLLNRFQAPQERGQKVIPAAESHLRAKGIAARCTRALCASVLLGACTSAPDTPYCGYEGKGPECQWGATSAAFEEAVLALVNEMRAQGQECDGEFLPPTDPLTMDAALQWSARFHARDMSERDYISLESPEGTWFTDRAADQGYQGRPNCQNIAYGYPTPKDIVEAWSGNSGDCWNMMRGKATEERDGSHGGIDQAGIGFFRYRIEEYLTHIVALVGGQSPEYQAELGD